MLLFVDPSFYLCFVSVVLYCLFIAALWSPAWEGRLVGDVSCVLVTFPCGVPGKAWYLIVSIPDLCLLPNFHSVPSVSTYYQSVGPAHSIMDKHSQDPQPIFLLTPLHFLYTKSLHFKHWIEFTPTPFRTTTQGNAPELQRSWL